MACGSRSSPGPKSRRAGIMQDIAVNRMAPAALPAELARQCNSGTDPSRRVPCRLAMLEAERRGVYTQPELPLPQGPSLEPCGLLALRRKRRPRHPPRLGHDRDGFAGANTIRPAPASQHWTDSSSGPGKPQPFRSSPGRRSERNVYEATSPSTHGRCFRSLSFIRSITAPSSPAFGWSRATVPYMCMLPSC
jgi:hypothetical protein